MPKYPSALYVFLKQSNMLLYIASPLGPTFWFCSRVLTRSRGKTQVTPMMPAMPPLMILGRRENCLAGTGCDWAAWMREQYIIVSQTWN